MIEPRMATMLGFLTTDAKVEPGVLVAARCAASSIDTFNAITVDGECSTNDCVFALASGKSGVVVTRDDDPAFLEALDARRRPPGARDRARRRGRDQARDRARHGRGHVGRRVAGRADDRELAARQDRDSRRRSELGPPGRGGRPIGRGVQSRSRVRHHRRGAALRERRAARRAGGRRRRTCSRRRTSRSPSTWAPADRTTPRCGRAISARSTCASTRSTGHESSGTPEIQGRDPDQTDRAEPPVALVEGLSVGARSSSRRARERARAGGRDEEAPEHAASRPINRWPAATSRCSSRSRRFGRAPRS